MEPKQKLPLVEWIAVVLFAVGSGGAIGSSELAEKTNQAVYWPGDAISLPTFFAGAALLLWSSRRRAGK